MVFDNSIPEWNLDSFYCPDSENLKLDLAALEDKRLAFESKRSLVSEGRKPSKEQFLDLIKELEDLSRLSQLLCCYASLYFASDTSNPKAQSFSEAMDEKMAVLDNSVIFFELWWKELDQESADELIKAAPLYDYWLKRTRAFKIHTLTEAEEKIINLKNATGSSALINLYDTITNGYRFKSAFLSDQSEREMTREELISYVRSSDPAHRQGAYQEFYRVYAQGGPLLGRIYQTLVRDWNVEKVVLRSYQSARGVRDKTNDLRPETVESLLRVCKEKGPSVFGRYFKAKAKALGLKALRRYDLYAPLNGQAETWSFKEAMAEVESAFDQFDLEFGQLAKRVLNEGRLGAQPRPGKAGGAFCASSVPNQTPWVLTNYCGYRHDVFTLAHELGHAVHSLMAKDLNLFHFHSALPLAETASTFGEMLLAKRFLDRGLTGRARDDLIFHLLDDAYATVGRQAFFSLFETKAHQMTVSGATWEDLNQAYYQNLQTQFGDSLVLSEDFCWEWVSIPHFFHTPFYVYAYSFGQLLVYSLWRLYEREGPDFYPRFKAVLARGGSQGPEAIVKEAGLGPLDDDFWLSGFEYIEQMLNLIER
ncbi:MAG: M3 family oligoendopeptidase [Deltaproteobacteria bacterium]|jgi:oligoendopeptidase F|nr:M3 family oligoendopeptidase [Deltaproteobacteria bacterium]